MVFGIGNNPVRGKNILITGGTGSFGYHIISKLLEMRANLVVVFSRDEYKQGVMREHFNSNPRLRFVIGDVRDKVSLMHAFRGIDIVFHAAAMKQIPACEHHPNEAIKTNVIGCQNVVEAALENDVKYVINLSADKSINPSGIYGATKFLSEKLFVNANLLGKTRFSNLRYSNVLGSRGSVVETFYNNLNNGKEIIVTDERMVRLVLTQDDVMELAFKALSLMIGGETFVKKTSLLKIKDLAEVMIDHLKKGSLTIGSSREGEKFDATLISEEESKHTVVTNDGYYIILPNYPGFDLRAYGKYYSNCKNMDLGEYGTNNAPVLNKEHIKNIVFNQIIKVG